MKYLTAALVALVLAVFGALYVAADTATGNWLTNPLYLAYDGVNLWQRECDADYYPIVYEVANARTESAYYGCVVASSGVDYLVSPLGADALNDASVYAIRHSSLGAGAPFYRIYKDDTNKNFAYYRESGTFVVTSGMQSESPNFKFYNSTLDAFEPQYDSHGALMEYSLKDTLGVDDREYDLPYYIYFSKLSTNGKYLVAAYAKNQKMILVKIDIRTGVHTEAPTGIAETGGLVIGAVSNDGRYVFIDKMEYGNKIESRAIYDLNTCEYDGGCQARDLGVVLGSDDPGSYFYDCAFRAKFNEDSSALTMWFFSGASLTISPLLIDDGRLEYLALGDSYSSGEGDIGRKTDGSSYYLPGTNSGIDNCHISTRSYPYLLRDMWNIPNDDMQSVACSGARVVHDYMRYEDGYLGQADRLAGSDDIATLQAESLQSFKPGYVQQIDFVKEYKPKIITLTGGGNDVGFARILEYCAAPQASDFIPFTNRTCGYAKPGSDLNKMLYKSIDAQYKPLKEFVDEVARVSPGTRVILVGYPSFIAEYNGVLCAPNAGVLDLDEKRMLNNAAKRLNSVIKRVAQDTDSDYVDTFDSLNGGRICEGSEYVTGVWSKLVGVAMPDERFHPNAVGHKKIAEVIDGSGVYTTKSVPISDYIVQPHTATQQMPLYANDAPIYRYGDEKPITTVPGTLLSGSQYKVIAHSDPVELGTFTALPDGSARASVSFANVPVGKHVLVLEGTTPDGTPATYYQFIEVRNSPDDADGDGIKDVDDRCNFITHWYDEATGEDICAASSAGTSKNNASVMPLGVLLTTQNQSPAVDLFATDESHYIVPTKGKIDSKSSVFVGEHEHASKNTSSKHDERPLIALVVLITIIGIIGGTWLKKIKRNS